VNAKGKEKRRQLETDKEKKKKRKCLRHNRSGLYLCFSLLSRLKLCSSGSLDFEQSGHRLFGS
jgi:hypothetical protein